MRNLKKFLALVLAMMMVFSLMLTANAYTVKTDFVDDDDITYREAAAVLQDLKIYEGGDDGEMDPKGDFTRAQLAALMYRVLNGPADTTAFQGVCVFTDVEETDWFNPYVNWVQMSGILHGVGDNKFDPTGKVTGYQVLALILQAMGYGEKGEFIGSGWKTYTVSYARSAGIDVTLTDSKLSEIASREEVAAMMFEAMQRPMVTWLSLTNGYVPAWVPIHTTNYYYNTTRRANTDVPYSLGFKYFGLTEDTNPYANGADWSRPYKRWFDGRTVREPTISLFPYETDVKFQEAIDECDIVDDFNLADGDIAWYYSDNAAVTTWDPDGDADWNIEAQGVGSQIGGNGMQTEIYKIGPYYWVVQINTWLAKVVNVTPVTTDRNGHPTKRSITLEIYYGNAGAEASVTKCYKTIETNDWAKGDYVLVSINKPGVNAETGVQTGTVGDIKKANTISVGELNSWKNANYPEPAKHTIGTSEKKDAHKFYLNWRTTGTWAAFGDQYGNVIGLGIANYSYAVIERIRWEHEGLDDDGYVSANLINANGQRIPGVRIATVNGKAVENVEAAQDTLMSEKVTDDWTTNTAFYGHLVTYSVDDETGEYHISAHAATTGSADNIKTSVAGNITDAGSSGSPVVYRGVTVKGDANIWNDVNGSGAPYSIANGDQLIGVGTSKTIYLVRNSSGRYDVVVGKENVPSITGADICVLSDEDGYATLVVIDGVTAGNNTTAVYYVPMAYSATDGVPAPTSTANIKVGNASPARYNGYQVYPLGETGTTTLYDCVVGGSTVLFDSGVTGGVNYVSSPGLYEIVTDQYGIVQSVKLLANNTNTTASGNVTNDTDNNSYASVTVDKVESANSIKAKYGNNSAVNYNLYDSTVYIEVNTNGLTKVNVNKVEANKTILVAYLTSGGVDRVQYVYIIKGAVAGLTPAPTPAEVPAAGVEDITAADLEGTAFEGADSYIAKGLTSTQGADGVVTVSGTVAKMHQFTSTSNAKVPGFKSGADKMGDYFTNGTKTGNGSEKIAIINIVIEGSVEKNFLWLVGDKTTTFTISDVEMTDGTTADVPVKLNLKWATAKTTEGTVKDIVVGDLDGDPNFEGAEKYIATGLTGTMENGWLVLTGKIAARYQFDENSTTHVPGFGAQMKDYFSSSTWSKDSTSTKIAIVRFVIDGENFLWLVGNERPVFTITYGDGVEVSVDMGDVEWVGAGS